MRTPGMIGRIGAAWLVGLGFCLACAAARAGAAEAVERPTERTRDCTEGGCHVAQTQFKVRHGPAAIGSCESCHLYQDEKKHTFKLRAEKAELCTFCHIGGGGPTGKVVHKPFEEGLCLSCHNPHGGTSRVLLRNDDLGVLCKSCHGEVTKNRQHLHGPVATGSCAACHGAHRSSEPKLLAATGRELCLSCHQSMENQIKHAKVLHKPLSGDCQQCHEVHASDYKMQLKKDPVALCESCHEAVKTQIAESTHKHSAVESGAGCLNCHTSHGGDMAKLMKSEPAKACLACHDKPIQLKDRVVASMAAVMDSQQNKHGPLRDGDCSGCHAPHGGQVARLLAKPYSEAFYEPFDLDKYGLCFSCHDKQLVLTEKTTGLTRFRNGSTNLHFVHVNKPDKGRNCRACHNTHTSTLPVHLRETVPFGKWEMPISYKQTPSGGSCRPGCHDTWAYDRDRPVRNVPGPAVSAK